MNTDKSTPRPWLAYGCVIESASRCVAVTRGGIARADWQDDCPDARLIVRAVNAHDAMREALRPFSALLAAHHADVPDDRPIFGINDAVFTAGDLRAARAALALADNDTDRSTTT